MINVRADKHEDQTELKRTLGQGVFITSHFVDSLCTEKTSAVDLDQDLHKSGKLEPDPDPLQSEKQDPDPDPYQSAKGGGLFI
jgi:hypothetical protein